MDEPDHGRLPGRLAAGPISWGACEVPGWGHQLTPDRVLSGVPWCRIDDVVPELYDSGYEKWLVPEQDLAITGPEPPVGERPTIDVRKRIEFLSNPAPRRERVSK